MSAILWGIISNWHSLEFRKLRGNIAGALAITAFFVIPGAFLGAFNLTTKVVWIELGMVVTTFVTLRLLRNRAVIAAELSTAAIAFGGSGGRGIVGTGVAGVKGYVRFAGALLASQLAALLIALWFPAHRSPAMALLLLPVSMVFVTLWIWQQGETMWPRIVRGVAWFTLAMALASVALPGTFTLLLERTHGIDGIAVTAANTSPMRFLVWAAGVLLIVAGVVSSVTKNKVFMSITAGLAASVAVLLAVDYFVFQDGLRPGPKPQVVCAPDLDRPLLQVLALQGPKRPVRVKRMKGPIAKYEINRGEVEGDLVIDFRDGSQDTWREGEQRRDDHWQTAPVRLYGEKGSVAKVTLFKEKCEEVAAKK